MDPVDQINSHGQRTKITEHQQIPRVCCYCNLRRGEETLSEQRDGVNCKESTDTASAALFENKGPFFTFSYVLLFHLFFSDGFCFIFVFGGWERQMNWLQTDFYLKFHSYYIMLFNAGNYCWTNVSNRWHDFSATHWHSETKIEKAAS